jgi:ABC-type phosphate transport system permease subunit
MSSVTVRLFAGTARACAMVVVVVPAVAVASLLWAAFRPALPTEPMSLSILGSVAFFSLAVAATAAAVGGGIGIGCAIAAEELAAGPARSLIEAAIAFLGATPAVVYGWFAIVLVVPVVERISSGPLAGYAAASIVLAAMVVPTACDLVSRALRKVPDQVRQAAAAVGASRLQSTAFVVIPALRRRIGAALLAAFARAIGEATAMQILFAYLGAATGLPATIASFTFGAVVTHGPSMIQTWVLLAGLSLFAFTAACALLVDREYRGMQWA